MAAGLFAATRASAAMEELPSGRSGDSARGTLKIVMIGGWIVFGFSLILGLVLVTLKIVEMAGQAR
jgi:hypothetical protein